MRTPVVALLVMALGLAGCVFDSKQVTVSFAMQPDSLVVTNTAVLTACEVDLGSVASFQSRKGEIRGLTDLALLGDVHNDAPTYVRIEWWMTRDATLFTTPAQVRANGIRLWGGLQLEPRTSLSLDWNKSAGLVNHDALEAVSGEIHGDGAFTLYAFSTLTGSGYRFTVEHSTLVLVLGSDS